MNEPQLWTLIGVFAAAFFAMLGVVSGLFTQVLRAEIGKVAVKVDMLDQKLERLDRKVEDLDRDVQAISRRVFPDRP